MQQAGMNIYLDILDCVLQEAVSIENDKKIVESIQKGISCSDALLCIVSDKTKLSWWVPYEIGIAEYSNLHIGSIKLSKTADFPSFLKTQKTINSMSSFLDFISNIHDYGPVFSKFVRNDMETLNYTVLNEYFW
ncbi:TIR domain-containing protein [Lachnospiraceae bacterium 66-29]